MGEGICEADDPTQQIFMERQFSSIAPKLKQIKPLYIDHNSMESRVSSNIVYKAEGSDVGLVLLVPKNNFNTTRVYWVYISIIYVSELIIQYTICS